MIEEKKFLTEVVTIMPLDLRLGPLTITEGGTGAIERELSMNTRGSLPWRGLGLQTMILPLYGSLPITNISCSSIG